MLWHCSDILPTAVCHFFSKVAPAFFCTSNRCVGCPLTSILCARHSPRSCSRLFPISARRHPYDTIRACLGLSATKPKVLAGFPDARLLHDGFRRLRGHLVGARFGERDVHRFAARAAFVATHIRKSRPLDLGASRYTGMPEQLRLLSTATLNGSEYAWLDRLKATNPEAYHYWFHAAR